VQLLYPTVSAEKIIITLALMIYSLLTNITKYCYI